jgi:putative FmdB family regulatory protein
VPTYAYACKDCGHEFDIVQSFTDDSLTECPACGGSLRKKFNSVGVVFKGSGFYRNDSRSEGSGSKGTSSLAPSVTSSASSDSGSTGASSAAASTTTSGSTGSGSSSSTSSSSGSAA